jgi:hypothetical protein
VKVRVVGIVRVEYPLLYLLLRLLLLCNCIELTSIAGKITLQVVKSLQLTANKNDKESLRIALISCLVLVSLEFLQGHYLTGSIQYAALYSFKP